jgi:hypothetical protein
LQDDNELPHFRAFAKVVRLNVGEMMNQPAHF